MIGFYFGVWWHGRSQGPGVELSLLNISVRVHDEGDMGKGFHFICFVHVRVKKVREVELRFVELGFVLRRCESRGVFDSFFRILFGVF